MRTVMVTGERLEIAAGVLARAFAEAERAYPNEACGFLLGPREHPAAVDGFRAVRNVQDALHTADPRRHPRTARTGYAVGIADLLVLAEQDGQQTVRVVFHSHPDGDAEFSADDRSIALSGGSAPTYPVQHLVIAVQGGRATHASLFDFSPATGAFRQVGQFPFSETP